MNEKPEVRVSAVLRAWWKRSVARQGRWRALRRLAGELASFLRDSTPERRRLRYGDAGYDWDNRVDTTSATVLFRERLLGVFHSPYQPTEPDLFREMMGSLQIDFHGFTFIDLGSGKGRTLLMAAEYPFASVLGIELLPRLHRIAEENISRFRSETQKCFHLESHCADAGEFCFPPDPTVLYLFNPFPEWTLERVMANLARSLDESPRAFYLLYHNPLLASVVEGNTPLKKAGGTHQYALYAFEPPRPNGTAPESLE